MLRVDKLPEILRSVLTDGIQGAVLMTVDGSILSSTLSGKADITETDLAAISASMWNNTKQGKLSCDAFYIHNMC